MGRKTMGEARSNALAATLTKLYGHLANTHLILDHFRAIQTHATRFPPAFLALQPHRAHLDDGPDAISEARLPALRPEAIAGCYSIRRLHRRTGPAKS